MRNLFSFAAAQIAGLAALAFVLVLGLSIAPSVAQDTLFIEPPVLGPRVVSGELPPVRERIPEIPKIVHLEGDLTPGTYGGELRTLISRARDIRLMSVYGYARLMGYTPELDLQPDLLLAVDVEEDRVYTLHLRPGHKWSDGAPFTTEDFRYWWEDVANNESLSPSGPPAELLVEGEAPVVEVIDEVTIRYSWSAPNPSFLDMMARARPVFIYRPAHYLRQFHENYGIPRIVVAAMEEASVSSWAALHNRRDNMYRMDNPDLPTLQPWLNTTVPPANRFIFMRNPYFHRVDENGRQLPYINEVDMTVAEGRLIPAMANAGETDLQSRGLNFSDATVLRGGEERANYRTILWPDGKSAHFALYPNLNVEDPVWRRIFRDVRVRRALSMGIDRHGINLSLFFGLAAEGGNTLQPLSPLYRESNFGLYAAYSPDEANRLLDDAGLYERGANGMRLLRDGRPMEIIIETAGEDPQEVDFLELVSETWAEIGVRVLIRTSSRDVMRNRAYSGEALMTVWAGWDNGLATASMSPAVLAPTRQDTLNWPKWGQYFQTGGQSGEPVDLAEAAELMALYREWQASDDDAEREVIWLRMLQIHAEQQFIIGVVSAVLQPIVVSNRLRNVPEQGVYSWDPGAQIGIYHPDQFWFDPATE